MIHSTPSPRFGMALSQGHKKALDQIQALRKSPQGGLKIELGIIHKQYKTLSTQVGQVAPIKLLLEYDQVTKRLKNMLNYNENNGNLDPEVLDRFGRAFGTSKVKYAVQAAMKPFMDSLTSQELLDLLSAISDERKFPEELDIDVSACLLKRVVSNMSFQGHNILDLADGFKLDKEA